MLKKVKDKYYDILKFCNVRTIISFYTNFLHLIVLKYKRILLELNLYNNTP